MGLNRKQSNSGILVRMNQALIDLFIDSKYILCLFFYEEPPSELLKGYFTQPVYIVALSWARLIILYYKSEMFSCAFAAIYKPPVTERYIDPTMIAILVAMALMFVIICVVLRLFSKSVLLPTFLLLFIMFSNVHHIQQCSTSCVFSIKYIHQKQKIIHSRSS